jgi:hypothetical protein
MRALAKYIRKHVTNGFVASAAALVLLVGPMSGTAEAAVINENTAGLSVSTFFPGNSLTTPNGGPWDHIAFNWFSDAPGTTPAAFGTLFLLTQEYLGTPAALSGATPGFVAQSSSIAAGRYLFDEHVVLAPNTRYFFYANASGLLSGNSDVPGENLYFSFDANTNYATTPADGNYRLTGDIVQRAVAEPSTLFALLIGLGLLGAALARSGSPLRL